MSYLLENYFKTLENYRQEPRTYIQSQFQVSNSDNTKSLKAVDWLYFLFKILSMIIFLVILHLIAKQLVLE